MAPRPQTSLTLIRTERIAPRLRRLVFGGPGFADYLAADLPATDKYVKLGFTDASGEQKLRTYTVRWVDAPREELAIDFVVHGDEGLAGPWAAAAEPGATITLRGPGGGYAPSPAADHHLFVGDEAALPAIAASAERLAPESAATAFIEIDAPGHEVPLADVLDVHWLYRSPAAPGTTTLMFDALRGWPWPSGRVQAFVHGESALLKTVRPWLLDGRVERADISVSAYWRRGETEEGFRTWKREQDDAVMRPEPA